MTTNTTGSQMLKKLNSSIYLYRSFVHYTVDYDVDKYGQYVCNQKYRSYEDRLMSPLCKNAIFAGVQISIW